MSDKKRKPSGNDVSKRKPVTDKWQNLLVVVTTKNGSYVKPCGANVSIILCHHEAWRGVLAYDEFAGTIVFRREAPWHAEDRIGKQTGTPWQDDDAVRLTHWLSRSTYEITVATSMAQEIVNVVAKKNAFHPVKEWLEALRWDGTRRLDDWLTRLAGADDTKVNRAIAAKFLLAAVARVYEPGCKVDTVPILEGDQGIGKSTLIRALCPYPEWFLETAIELGNLDSFQALRGKWIVELAELDSLNRSELSRVKAYITSQQDTFRKSYGRIAQTFPRRCVFSGTTNADEYLKDDTGGRRFWPVKVSRVDVEGLKKERNQLWAEAVVRYKKKERWHLTDKALLGEFEKVQETRRQVHPWEPIIARYLQLGYYTENKYDNTREFHAPPGKAVTMETILTGPLGLDVSRVGRGEHMIVGAILRKLGWRRRQTYIGSEYSGYEYARPAKAEAKQAQVINLRERRGADQHPPTRIEEQKPRGMGKTPSEGG